MKFMSDKNKKYEDDEEEIEEIDDISNMEIDEETIDEMIIDEIDIDEIDINESDVKEEIVEDSEFDIMFKVTANKHKLEGTHSLKRDTIFMGKLDEEVEEGMEDSTMFPDYDTDNYQIEKGSAYEVETRHYEDYYYQQCLTQDIYRILGEKTEIDFVENRRKPNKLTFNNYYLMCNSELGHKYTKSEIFVELSYYFTDNIFNMFKLLNKKNATGIILELKDKGYLTDIGNINFI